MRIIISAVLFSLAFGGAVHAAPASRQVTYDPADLVGCDMEHPYTRPDGPRYRCSGAYLSVEGSALVRHELTEPPHTAREVPATSVSPASGMVPPGCVPITHHEHPDWYSTCKVIAGGQVVSWSMYNRAGQEIPGASIAETRPQRQTGSSTSSDDCGKHLSGRPSQEVAYRDGNHTGCMAVREKSRIPEMLAGAVVLGVLDGLSDRRYYGDRGYYDRGYGRPAGGRYYRVPSMARPGDPLPGGGGQRVP